MFFLINLLRILIPKFDYPSDTFYLWQAVDCETTRLNAAIDPWFRTSITSFICVQSERISED